MMIKQKNKRTIRRGKEENRQKRNKEKRGKDRRI